MARWSDIFDAFTSIDDKLDELNKNMKRLIELLTARGKGIVVPPVEVVTPPTTPKVMTPSKIITIPGKVTPLEPVTLTLVPDKDSKYRLLGDVSLIMADGDDVYVNIRDTTITGNNNFKLTDGSVMIINAGNITLHFRSASTTAYVRIWSFTYL